MKEKKVSFLKFKMTKSQTMLQVIEGLLYQYRIVRLTEVTKIKLIPELMKLFLEELSKKTSIKFDYTEKTIISYNSIYSSNTIEISSMTAYDNISGFEVYPIKVYFLDEGKVKIGT